MLEDIAGLVTQAGRNLGISLVTLLGCVTNQARARLATDSGSRDARLVVAPGRAG